LFYGPIRPVRGPDRIIAIVVEGSFRQARGRDCRSGDDAEVLAQRIPIDARSELFNLFVCALPYGQGSGEKASSFFGENQDPAATIGGVGLDLNQPAAFQRLQRSGQRRPIHRKQGSDRPHRRRLRAIQGHEQGELPVGEFERAKFFIESPRQGTRCTLHVETETSILDQQSCFEGQRFCT